MPSDQPLISIIVPHFSGAILLECLDSIFQTTANERVEIIVVNDNPVPDDNLREASAKYPTVVLVNTNGAQGYGASCNKGFLSSQGEFVLFLNNDAILTAHFFPPLLAQMEGDSSVAFCQPKVLSRENPSMFDAGGAAGGLLDCFGYPFALGSLVHTVEKDCGQYDCGESLFWAYGAALFARRTVLSEIGGFDETFFMQMEEIDLSWRALLRGYQIRSVPESVVLHYRGRSLPENTVRRFYLSHRNNLRTLIKNFNFSSLALVLPGRVFLELATMLYSPIFRRNWKQPVGIIWALFWLLTHPWQLVQARYKTQVLRRVTDRLIWTKIYGRSILFDYFVCRRKTVSDLRKSKKGAAEKAPATKPPT